MRLPFALAVVVLAVATWKLVEVGPTAYGGAIDPWLLLPAPVATFVLYGVGLALLLLAGAAHVGLPAAASPIARTGRGGALATAAIVAGVVVLGGLWRWIWLGQLALPAEYGERPRFLAVALVLTAHLTFAGLLLVALGVRIARLRRDPRRAVIGRAGAALRR